MATYYVRPGGTGSGTGPAINQAWGTFQAPFTSGSGVTGGDTVYIAPGHYNEKVTITITSPTSTVNIIGDVTGSQFSGVSAGFVRLSGFASTGNAAVNLSAPQLSATSKDYLSFSNIIFEGSPTGGAGTSLVRFITSKNITLSKCLFVNDVAGTIGTDGTLLQLTATTSVAMNHTISKCIFVLSGRSSVVLIGANVADSTAFTDCLFQGGSGDGIYIATTQLKMQNCTFVGNNTAALVFASGNVSFPSTVTNSLFLYNLVGISGSSTIVSENYNRFISCATNRSGTIATGANSTSVGASRLDYGYSRMVGLNPIDFYGPQQSSPNQAFGTSTGAEATDVMSITWTGATPDSGYQTYSSVATLSPTYNPTERNAGVITIAPGSTSQSIELYLGATGLTFATSGLSAYYVRNRSAPVAITLVTQTATGSWASGGFAEISSSLTPGVYRLDVPDAALIAGVDDVTIVVRGASGTNGAVMTVKLSSGGLTSAQTAAAVWDEARSSHVTAGTFGQYVNAELVTPVTSAALVRMGPYEVKADGLGASDPLDIQKGAQHGVDIQCVDAFGSGIDITSATVTAKVYNSGATLVDTYACTATYAADGRATFTIDTTVTDTPGTYTATITRTTGASDTQVFGPLRIYVRDI